MAEVGESDGYQMVNIRALRCGSNLQVDVMTPWGLHDRPTWSPRPTEMLNCLIYRFRAGRAQLEDSEHPGSENGGSGRLIFDRKLGGNGHRLF